MRFSFTGGSEVLQFLHTPQHLVRSSPSRYKHHTIENLLPQSWGPGCLLARKTKAPKTKCGEAERAHAGVGLLTCIDGWLEAPTYTHAHIYVSTWRPNSFVGIASTHHTTSLHHNRVKKSQGKARVIFVQENEGAQDKALLPQPIGPVVRDQIPQKPPLPFLPLYSPFPLLSIFYLFFSFCFSSTFPPLFFLCLSVSSAFVPCPLPPSVVRLKKCVDATAEAPLLPPWGGYCPMRSPPHHADHMHVCSSPPRADIYQQP